jgi:hypothetical protein
MSLKITQDNYSTYKKVFEIISQRLCQDLAGRLPPEANPVNVLHQWEKQSKPVARRALETGLNDCLSNLKNYPEEIIAAINAELWKNELPDIQTLSGVIQMTIEQVMKAGRIRTTEQYYIVKEVLDDTASGIPEAQRNSLSSYLGTYESTRNR